jgi:hypothetical protein
MKFYLATPFAFVSSLLLPLAAHAASSPVLDQYGNPVAGASQAASAAQGVAGLPFTGLELGYLVLAGIALVGCGVMLCKVGFAAGRPRRARP